MPGSIKNTFACDFVVKLCIFYVSYVFVIYSAKDSARRRRDLDYGSGDVDSGSGSGSDDDTGISPTTFPSPSSLYPTSYPYSTTSYATWDNGNGDILHNEDLAASEIFVPVETRVEWQDGAPVVDYDSTFERWDNEEVEYKGFLGDMDIMTAKIAGML